MIIDFLLRVLLDFFSVLLPQLLHSSLLFILFLPFIYKYKDSLPGLAHCLCWLVILRLLVPVGLASPISLRSLFDNTVGIENSSLVFDSYFYGGSASAAVVEAAPEFGLLAYLLVPLACLWLCCSIFLALEYRLVRRQYREFARNGFLNNNAALQLSVDKWKKLFGIRRKVKLVFSREAQFAYTIGALSPSIVLPESLVNCDREKLEVIVSHELGHIKRFDDLAIVILIFVQSLFFFFPVVRVCSHVIGECREKLCDREVLSQQTIDIKFYAKSLLHLNSREYANEFSQPSLIAQSNDSALLVHRLRFFKRKNVMQKTRPLKSACGLILTAVLLFPMSSLTETVAKQDIFVSPVKEGRISSRFGLRLVPVGPEKGKQKFHNGIDIAGETGTSIFAIAAGVVVDAVENSERSAKPHYGKYLVIQHQNGMQSRYMHLHSLDVDLGESVRSGQIIGAMGMTGRATGPHLHFELVNQSEYLNPAEHIYFEFEKPGEN